MSSAPDPSQPNQMDARIRELIYQALSDPLAYPPEMTNWLSTFVSLNAATEGGTPVTQSTTSPST